MSSAPRSTSRADRLSLGLSRVDTLPDGRLVSARRYTHPIQSGGEAISGTPDRGQSSRRSLFRIVQRRLHEPLLARSPHPATPRAPGSSEPADFGEVCVDLVPRGYLTLHRKPRNVAERATRSSNHGQQAFFHVRCLCARRWCVRNPLLRAYFGRNYRMS